MNIRQVLIVSCFAGCAHAAQALRQYTVDSYAVSLQPDLSKQRLAGTATLGFHGSTDRAVSALELDAGELQIGEVLDGEAKQYFERKGPLLLVILSNPLHVDEHRTITVRYVAGPSAGLKFFEDQVYSTETSAWMPCNDRASERATLQLKIATPPGVQAVASGQEAVTGEWRIETPTQPYYFGFAAGKFFELTADADGVKLRVSGGTQKSLDATAAAMHYLTEKSGKHYPGTTYTQVFVHGYAARPFAGWSLLPEKQADNNRLITMQLAQQWYGVAIVTNEWSDLWLSEGISAFLADEALGQIEQAHQSYNQLRAEGKDRPLSDNDFETREKAAGEVPQQKGAWFLYLVNQVMGDAAFWNGLRLYTAQQWGQVSSSEDLQHALDGANTVQRPTEKKAPRKGEAGNKIDNLFDLWVYGIPDMKTK